MNTQTVWRRLDAELDGIALSHEMRAGEAPVLMVHGVGPGTTGRLNFAPLFDRFSPAFAIHVIDLAGFGASQGLPEPHFDVGFWLRQIDLAIDIICGLHGRAPMLIGNSVGGALVLKAAAARPEVRKVLAIGAPAAPPAPAALRAFWTAPVDAQALAEAMRPMTGPASAPELASLQARLAAFRVCDYGRYFNSMLADPDACLAAAVLRPDEALRIRAHVALLHGRLDRACPAATFLSVLAPMLPAADITLLGGCGHNVISERSPDVVAAVQRLAGKVDLP